MYGSLIDDEVMKARAELTKARAETFVCMCILVCANYGGGLFKLTLVSCSGGLMVEGRMSVYCSFSDLFKGPVCSSFDL